MKNETYRSRTSLTRIATCSGFAYIEVLVAIILVAVALVPIMEALQSAVGGTAIHESIIVDMLALQSKIEEVLKEPFTALETAALKAGSPTTPTIYSDTAPITTSDGRQITRQVYIWLYDADNVDGDDDPFTGADAGLLYIRAEIEGSALFIETLTNE